MTSRRILVVTVSVFLAAAGVALYVVNPWRAVGPPGGGGPETGAVEPGGVEPVGAPEEFLASHRGKVLVLLLGREDCPGTARATAALDGYVLSRQTSPERSPALPERGGDPRPGNAAASGLRPALPGRSPADVAVVRVEVPLPNETPKVSPEWNHPYPRRLDVGRQLAEHLAFFFYPTLYVFDPDSVQRFAGGCDPARIEQMAAEILAEKPGDPRKSYNLPLPPVGQPPPALAGVTLDGREATLDSLRGAKGTLLVFCRTNCPFTIEALPAIAALAAEQKGNGVATVIVNSSQEKDAIGTVYDRHCPGLPVVWDRGGDISTAYGVDVTPFYFLVGGDGKVAQRRSFTPAAAAGSINALLGLAAETPRYKPTEAG